MKKKLKKTEKQAEWESSETFKALRQLHEDLKNTPRTKSNFTFSFEQ